MAGLLDIFGTSGQDTMGLLGMSPEDIGRSRDEAQAQALYALAGRLFKGGSGASSVLEGLQQGQQAYKTAMQGGLQEQLQKAQLQEMLKKKQLEQQQLAEQKRIQTVISSGTTPEIAAKPAQMVEEEGRYLGETPAVEAKPAGFDLGRIAPQLIGSPEGRKTLSELLAAHEALSGKTTTLAEGASLIRINPITGAIENVAQGAPKREPVPSAIAEYKFAQDQGYKGSFQQFELDKRAAGAPKVAVDLNDKTAVAKAQLATVNQWQGTIKDTGDTVIANRASAFYDAYDKAAKGNASADGALIYNLAKIYDQTGAVQQGDIKSIIGHPSVPQRIQLLAQQLLEGGTFTPKQRADSKSIVDGIVAERQKALEPTINVYRNLNTDLGGKSEAIINPYDVVRKSELTNLGLPTGVTVRRKS
jgi:hypothetical protein